MAVVDVLNGGEENLLGSCRLSANRFQPVNLLYKECPNYKIA
jgi:hypothetical protein